MQIDPSPSRLRPVLRSELAAVAICLAAAIAWTWPMVAHFTTHLGGDPGDPFQTLWSMRWMHDALTSLRNPFFTDRVYYPHGSTLIFQTFDIPTAILLVPLWWFLPPVAVYNAGVLFGFALTAWGMYRLVRELSGDWLVSIAAGVLFTATPYHLAHVQGHQHLVSMGWLPLYFVYLHRMLTGRARPIDAGLGGLFLALASLASWYHLLYALVATPVLFAWALLRQRPHFLSRRFLRDALTLAATYLLVAGPLLLAILHTRATEPIEGAHDAVRFSGDLEAFFFPNLAQGWGHWWGGRAFHWTGNAAETALYAGYALLAAAIAGLVRGGSLARAWFAAAMLGAVLSLGPWLHVGGKVLRDVPMPYLLLEKLLPMISFMGVPVRLGYVMYLGLIICAALGLSAIRRGISRPALSAAVVLVPAAITLLEYTPRRFIETKVTMTPALLALADDPKAGAVLDISDDYRMMWHATLHRRPMTGGNLTRVPRRQDEWYWQLPIVRALRSPTFRHERLFERTDAVIDFDWGEGGPDPRLGNDGFRISWRGELLLPSAGTWTLHLTSDDGSSLSLGGRRVIDNGGRHPMRERSVTLDLEAGPHPIQLDYEEVSGGAGVRLEWSSETTPRGPIPASALRTAEGEPGLRGVYFRGVKRCGLQPGSGRAALREIGVRHLITRLDDGDCAAKELGLEELFAGDGIRLFRVPDEPSGSGRHAGDHPHDRLDP